MGWRIEELIGWGASAKVYRARRPGTNRAVAIKIINKPRSRIGYGIAAISCVLSPASASCEELSTSAPSSPA